ALDQSVIILLIILGVSAVIAIVSYILYRVLHLKIKDSEIKDEKDIAKEELDRILEPIEDEELSKKVAEYDDEEENKEK
ncbi:MAG: hypothetical protein GX807_04065, partial [Erysipelotrichia bacterium]|nr:hypothetical protein [Erysipelotrichia bacterium]